MLNIATNYTRKFFRIAIKILYNLAVTERVKSLLCNFRLTVLKWLKLIFQILSINIVLIWKILLMRPVAVVILFFDCNCNLSRNDFSKFTIFTWRWIYFYNCIMFGRPFCVNNSFEKILACTGKRIIQLILPTPPSSMALLPTKLKKMHHIKYVNIANLLISVIFCLQTAIDIGHVIISLATAMNYIQVLNIQKKK